MFSKVISGENLTMSNYDPRNDVTVLFGAEEPRSQMRVQEPIGRGWDSHLTTGRVSEFMCNTAIHSMVLACFHWKELSLEGGV